MSCNAYLLSLNRARDRILNGEMITEVTGRTGTVRYESPAKLLQYLNEEIGRETARTSGPARNRVRLMR